MTVNNGMFYIPAPNELVTPGNYMFKVRLYNSYEQDGIFAEEYIQLEVQETCRIIMGDCQNTMTYAFDIDGGLKIDAGFQISTACVGLNELSFAC